ncbi:helix-turn-helix domain-containing protein [Erysipelothrix aquatica]|uniref:helix-turn-helix domain-containing protein n=1 Tax=Erysipelothrix aquatica TaxID=2683714 RepID=UPI0013577C83|nr:helix-turn-helix transcriptional regulator [Erysipelothrix aquatica]
MLLNEYLKYYREVNGYTQEALAEKLMISRQAISKWERGESMPDIENIIMLSDLYDISIDQLLRGSKHLKKPYQIGERNLVRNTVIGFVFALFFGATMTIRPYIWTFFIFCGFFMFLTLIMVKEGRIIIGKRDITAVHYQSWWERLIAIFKPQQFKKTYGFDDIDIFKINYTSRPRIGIGDWGPDSFNISLLANDGAVYTHEVTATLSKDLPILCDYLGKKGVAIEDDDDIIPMIVTGKSIYDEQQKKYRS